MRQVFREPSLQALFEEQGYVVVQLLGEDEVATLRACEARLVGNDAVANFPDGSEVYASYFDEERKRSTSQAAGAVLGERLAALLCGYDILMTSFMVKFAGGGPLWPHQHPPFIADHTDTSVTCWCPLQACDGRSGALQVVPGSHKLLWHLQTQDEFPYWTLFHDRITDTYFKTFELRPGEAVLFDDTLIHASAPNLRDERRIAVIANMIPKDAVPAFFFKNESPEGGYGIYKPPTDYCYFDQVNGTLPPRDQWEQIGTYADRNVAITQDQFDRLLANRVRIAPGVDPYEAVAGMAPARLTEARPERPASRTPLSLARRVLGKIRRTVERA
jgi:hypothetical protein